MPLELKIIQFLFQPFLDKNTTHFLVQIVFWILLIFLISYIIPLLDFSLFIYLLKVLKGSYQTINAYQANFGSLFLTLID